MKKEIIVLGAGISGLSLSWFLKKRYGNQINIKILEKSSRVGGWIQTKSKGGFLFEQGPRSCRTKGNGLETLKLIEELQLQDEVITADLSANKRFLYTNKQLTPLPDGIFSFLLSPYFKPIMKALWQDWHAPKGVGKDESIYDFISRRLGPKIAEGLFDPLVTGIYAGDIKELSIRSCFPVFFEWEQNYGGLVKALLLKQKHQKSVHSPFIQEIAKHSIFTLKEGLESLPLKLAKKLNAEILLESEVVSLKMQGSKINIKLLNDFNLTADYVFSTLPTYALNSLIHDDCPEGAQILQTIPYTTVTTCNLGYRDNLLKQKGFGYLIPSKEKEEILGTVWDSSVFPQQQKKMHTSLTVMLGGVYHPKIKTLSNNEILKKSQAAISKHLGIHSIPTESHVNCSYLAIPQHLVGHLDKLNALQKCILNKLPLLTLLGSYFSVSINDCIANAKKVASSALEI